jgi:hypothetical protein
LRSSFSTKIVIEATNKAWITYSALLIGINTLGGIDSPAKKNTILITDNNIAVAISEYFIMCNCYDVLVIASVLTFPLREQRRMNHVMMERNYSGAKSTG